MHITRRFLALVAASFLATGGLAAESIDALKSRQTKLEADLEKVKTQISVLEAKAAESPAEPAKPFWYVTDFGIEEVNSAGGVEPYFVFYNPNESSPIKYIRLSIRLYNAVGDAITSDIGDLGAARLSYTGPLANSYGDKRADWGSVWYNSTGHCIRLESIQVTFVNGKSASFAGKALKRAINPRVTNECRMK